MSDSDYQFSEDEDTQTFDIVSENEDSEVEEYSPELREAIFNNTYNFYEEIGNEEPVKKKERVRKEKENNSMYLDEFLKKQEEEEKNKNKSWTSSRVTRRKRNEGKLHEEVITRKFNPRLPPPERTLKNNSRFGSNGRGRNNSRGGRNGRGGRNNGRGGRNNGRSGRNSNRFSDFLD